MKISKAETDKGRELLASELIPGTVVVIQPPAHSFMITMWYIGKAGDDMITFHSEEMHWTVINFVRDDKIYDDQDRQVHVYEYLGEV